MIEIKVNEEVTDLKCDLCGKTDWREGVRETISKDETRFYCAECAKDMSLFQKD